MQFKLNKLTSSMDALTQTGRLGHPGLPSAATNRQAPHGFTRTNMASQGGHAFFEMGTSKMDPLGHARVLLQYAHESGTPFVEVKTDYLSLFLKVGASSESFRKIIAGLVGTVDRSLPTNRIPRITPTQLFEVVKKVMGEVGTYPELYARLFSDFVGHMLSSLGWMTPDAPYVFCLTRHSLFPNYDGTVELVEAKDLVRVFQTLASADLAVVKALQDAKTAIMPALIAQHMANAVLTAYDLSRGAYDSQSIVTSVLTLLARSWDIETPREISPRERITASSHFSELKANFSVFLLAQEMMLRPDITPEVSYGDEEMVSTIIPIFMAAINELSPYKTRLLTDVAGVYAKASSRDHTRHPGRVIISEDWDFAPAVGAFTTVRATREGEARYLPEAVAISTALEASMKPLQRVLSVPNIVRSAIETYEMAPASTRIPSHGTEMRLAFPSLVAREIELGLPLGALQEALIKGVVPDQVTDGTVKMTNTEYLSLIGDYYALICHLAVAKAGAVAIATYESELTGRRVPFMVWTINTDLVKPVGPSAIMHGVVQTVEPLEALAYVADFSATAALSSPSPDLDTYRRSVHIWSWHKMSQPLKLAAVYGTTVGGNTYEAAVDEHELLGVGMRRPNVRFFTPVVASAVARMWLDMMDLELKYIAEMISTSKDTMVQDAFKGRQVATALDLFNSILSIGAVGAGARASSMITSRLAVSMYNKGKVDESTELMVGIQRHKINVWAGLVTMQLLGLMTADDITELMSRLRKADVMSLVIGMTNLDERTSA